MGLLDVLLVKVGVFATVGPLANELWELRALRVLLADPGSFLEDERRLLANCLFLSSRGGVLMLSWGAFLVLPWNLNSMGIVGPLGV